MKANERDGEMGGQVWQFLAISPGEWGIAEAGRLFETTLG